MANHKPRSQQPALYPIMTNDETRCDKDGYLKTKISISVGISEHLKTPNRLLVLAFISLCVIFETIHIQNMTNDFLPVFFNDYKV